MREDYMIQKSNGLKIAGTLYTPETEGPYPLVLILHGFGANCELLRAYAPSFTEAGFAFAVFDFCGGGPGILSDGDMRDMTIPTEVEDLGDVIAYFDKRPDIDSAHLFILGESIGGLVASCYCAKHKDTAAGLALWYPALVIPHDAKQRYEEGVTEAFGLDMNPDFDRIAKDLDFTVELQNYGRDVLLLHGDEDDLSPLFYSELVAEKCSNVELRLMRGSGHGFSGENREKACKYTIEYFKKHF